MLKIENLLITSYGVITVLVFTSMLVVGGLFDSLQSLLFREVSYIVSPYISTSDFTIPLYQLYNYYLILFAFALSLRMKSVYAKLGSLHLILSAMIGLSLVQFPMDPQGKSASYTGITHIVIVLFMCLYIMVALVLLAYAFKRMKRLRWLSNYSVILSFILLYLGFFTGIFALLSMPHYVGVIEKLPIAVFLFWIILTAVGMVHSDKRIKHYIWHS